MVGIKQGWALNLAQEIGDISKACKVMGFCRDTFYRYQETVETGGMDQLVNRSKRGPNVKNRIDLIIEDAVKALAL